MDARCDDNAGKTRRRYHMTPVNYRTDRLLGQGKIKNVKNRVLDKFKRAPKVER